MIPIAIPSYNRADTLKCKTLRYLHQQQIPREQIYIFVASEAEKKEYEERIPPELYGHMIVGKLGLSAQRNFIRDWFSESEILCQMDDDVKSIKTLHGLSLAEFLEKAKKELEGGCGLFGVLPNADARRFKDDMTYHLTHILGSFFVCRNHREIEMSTQFKEDFERSILYFKKYGKVARYRGGGVETTFQEGSGGLQCADRKEKTEAEMQDLLGRFPGFVKRVEKSTRSDIQLNWRAR